MCRSWVAPDWEKTEEVGCQNRESNKVGLFLIRLHPKGEEKKRRPTTHTKQKADKRDSVVREASTGLGHLELFPTDRHVAGARHGTWGFRW